MSPRPAPSLTDEEEDHRDPANRVRGRANHRAGDEAQALIGNRLRSLGLLMVRRIETGWKVLRNPKTGKLKAAFPLEKVAGDWLALLPGGRSVLVEVKYSRERLCYSDLLKHQVEALNEHGEAGGLSLVGWVNELGAHVMLWPCLEERQSMVPQRAKLLDGSAQVRIRQLVLPRTGY